jgi:hypothetical protein
VAALEPEDYHLRMLTPASEAWDWGHQARDAMAVHGLVYADEMDEPTWRLEVALERIRGLLALA